MTVTVNTVGNLVLQRQYFKNCMQIGAPTASVGSANPAGWSDERLFFVHLKHCISYERCFKEDQVLSILDSHGPHLSNPAISDKKKMALYCLHCHPVHHTSYSHWTAPPLVNIIDITGPAVDAVNMLQCLL